jgi:hypothetical protein
VLATDLLFGWVGGKVESLLRDLRIRQLLPVLLDPGHVNRNGGHLVPQLAVSLQQRQRRQLVLSEIFRLGNGDALLDDGVRLVAVGEELVGLRAGLEGGAPFGRLGLQGRPLALQGGDALAQLARLGMAAGDELLGGGERTVLEARVATHHLVLERLVFLLQGCERAQVLRLKKKVKFLFLGLLCTVKWCGHKRK